MEEENGNGRLRELFINAYNGPSGMSAVAKIVDDYDGIPDEKDWLKNAYARLSELNGDVRTRIFSLDRFTLDKILKEAPPTNNSHQQSSS